MCDLQRLMCDLPTWFSCAFTSYVQLPPVYLCFLPQLRSLPQFKCDFSRINCARLPPMPCSLHFPPPDKFFLSVFTPCYNWIFFTNRIFLSVTVLLLLSEKCYTSNQFIQFLVSYLYLVHIT